MNRTNNWLARYLAAVLFLLPWQAVWLIAPAVVGGEPSQYLSFGVYAIDALLLVGVVWGFSTTKWRQPVSRELGFGVVALFAVLAANIFFATAPLVAAVKAVTILLVFLFGWTVYRHGDHALSLSALIGAGVVQAIVGLQQFFGQTISPSTLFGIAAQSSEVAGASVIEVADGRWLRAYGSFPHPNVLGGFLALVSLVVVGQYFVVYERFQKWWDGVGVTKDAMALVTDGTVLKTGAKVAALLAAFTLTVAGLYVTFSRAAVIGFVLGLVVLLAAKYFRNRVRAQVLGIKLVVTLLAVVVALEFVAPPLWQARVSASTRLETQSRVERVDGYQQAAEVVRGHALQGVGLGGYTAALIERNPGAPAYVYQPVHNVFALLLVELGLVGAAVVVYLLAQRWRSLVPKSAVSWALAVALLPLLLLDHYLWSLHAGLLLWLIFPATTRRADKS